MTKNGEFGLESLKFSTVDNIPLAVRVMRLLTMPRTAIYLNWSAYTYSQLMKFYKHSVVSAQERSDAVFHWSHPAKIDFTPKLSRRSKSNFPLCPWMVVSWLQRRNASTWRLKLPRPKTRNAKPHATTSGFVNRRPKPGATATPQADACCKLNTSEGHAESRSGSSMSMSMRWFHAAARRRAPAAG